MEASRSVADEDFDARLRRAVIRFRDLTGASRLIRVRVCSCGFVVGAKRPSYG
jgi:hypothetical protein